MVDYLISAKLVSQISDLPCIHLNSSVKLQKPLNFNQTTNNNYTFGLIRIDTQQDGIFVKDGCRGKFLVNPGNEEIYCSSMDSRTEYCTPKGEVFHISGPIENLGLFTKAEAENLCSIYNAKLATLQQLVASVEHRSDWCSGGWIRDDDSLSVFYPNQLIRSSFNLLSENGRVCGKDNQTLSYRNFTGRIGIFSPLNFKAGVNCYGRKPAKVKDGFLWPFHPFRFSMYDDLNWTPYNSTITENQNSLLSDLISECIQTGGVFTNGINDLHNGCGSEKCCFPSVRNWYLGKHTSLLNWKGADFISNAIIPLSEQVNSCVRGLGVFTSGQNSMYPGCGNSSCCVAQISS
jgi:hypothetical protein